MSAQPLLIEIVSDVVCPWCYVGKRRLEAALLTYKSRFPDADEPTVRWLPFQLNPDLPEQGISRQQHVERKFGPGKRDNSNMIALGKSVGIEFNFDAITVQPNTLNAHRLMYYGAQQDHENTVAESLFRGFFIEGAVLTDLKVLADLGERAGLERSALEAYLASDQDRDVVRDGDIEARRSGVNGVPFFIFNRSVAVSGAHEPQALLDAMLQSLETEDGAVTNEG